MMLKITQIQPYLQQPHVVKSVIGVLAVLLLLSIYQWVRVGFTPAQDIPEAVYTEFDSITVFIPSPLFGQSPTSEVLQQTSLNLTLKGTFAASHSLEGAAVIRAPETGDKIYVVSDTVPGGAIIKEIYPDHVVLEYQGSLEVLRLPEQRLTR